jgi:hypothetical protein
MTKQYASRPSGMCTACRKYPANQWHHRFSRVKWALALYGAKLMDDVRNLQAVCNCHASHASPHLTFWNESEFCAALGIEPRSKTARSIA